MRTPRFSPTQTPGFSHAKARLVRAEAEVIRRSMTSVAVRNQPVPSSESKPGGILSPGKALAAVGVTAVSATVASAAAPAIGLASGVGLVAVGAVVGGLVVAGLGVRWLINKSWENFNR